MRKKQRRKWKRPLLIFLTIFLIFSTSYLIYAIALYKSIETKIRVVGCITLIVLFLLIFTLLAKFKMKYKNKLFIILSIITIIYCSGLTFVAYKVNGIYNKIAVISSNNYNNYSTSIITRNNYNDNDIDDIDGKIGMITDKEDYEGYTLANKIIKEEKLTNIAKYDSYVDLLNALVDEKIDYALVPTHYDSMFSNSEELEDIGQNTKIIYTKEEQVKKEKSSKAKKSLDEPFTVLIMGVDTVSDGFTTGFNGDSLILVTFNPKTTNTTILSIPRDTYMPIACMSNRKTKITNAGWRGQDCIIESLENYFDIEIDYHVKINFNGVVKLVDALGGIEVDVPYSFCEQDSQRKWGKNTVFVESGKQVLNGEQALAFARHRKVNSYMVSYCGPKYTTNSGYWNDFRRGQNQQIIINALLNKLKDIDDFDTIEEILNTISENIETDISTDDILSLYNLAKDILKKSSNKEEALSMQKLYLSGHDAYIYDYSFTTNSGSKLVLYNYNIYKESKDAVIKAMKENLELESTTPIKEFSFSITEEYEEYIIGKNIGTTTDLTLMPNFIGLNVSEAKSFASSNKINLSINYVNGTYAQFDGEILSQSIPANTDLDMLNKSRSMTITVVQNVNIESNPTSNNITNNENNNDDKSTNIDNETDEPPVTDDIDTSTNEDDTINSDDLDNNIEEN